MSDAPAKENLLKRCFPARYVFAFLANIGMAIVYGLKVNLSVTMVAMLNHTAHGGDKTNKTDSKQEECKPPDGMSQGGSNEDGPFTWSEPLQGTLLSCYFWGYMVSQIPLARIAELLSAKWVFFFSVAANIICTLLTPILTKLHYGGLICMRVIEGIGGGASFPAMHIMIASWAPQAERLLITSLIYVGTSAGTAVSIMMSGVLAAKLGWESVFYVMGGLSCIWMILWIILVQDNPNKQKLMTAKERDMINSSLGTGGDKGEAKKMPWCKIFKSCPFWALLIAHTCSNVGWYMFLIEIPFYMKHVLKFNVSKNAIYSALPYIPMMIFSVILSKILDTLQNREKINRTTARKIATAFCSIIPAACLVGLCFIGCLHYVAVGIMCLGIISMGAMFCGFLSNHMDISPNFAGTLMALTNTVATLPGIIVPQLVGFITEGNQTIGAWRIIFIGTVVAHLIEFIVFTLFGKGVPQPWNDG
ncbi:sialin-like [Drosophila montana]|uniref:sialin-like n=1 Tax=Drosophila montana TaxID=40370 RepID=UPI00313CCBC4